MKPIYRFDCVDFTEFNKDNDVIYENHYKAKTLFGIPIFRKRYRAITNRAKMNLQTGFKRQ